VRVFFFIFFYFILFGVPPGPTGWGGVGFPMRWLSGLSNHTPYNFSQTRIKKQKKKKRKKKHNRNTNKNANCRRRRRVPPTRNAPTRDRQHQKVDDGGRTRRPGTTDRVRQPPQLHPGALQLSEPGGQQS
jgi:hypothetical protein